MQYILEKLGDTILICKIRNFKIDPRLKELQLKSQYIIILNNNIMVLVVINNSSSLLLAIFILIIEFEVKFEISILL